VTTARERFLVAASVALAALVLYVACLSSTVTYTGDCGELITASYRLGIAHPSGYSLFCLLGRTFASLLPLGEVAWRYNLLAALLCAIAVGFVTATVHRLTVGNETAPGSTLFYRNWPAIGAGLLLAGFYEYGTQAVITEVSGLEAITETAAFYCIVAWHQDDDWRWAYTGALCFGLAILAHLTSIFWLPAFLYYTLWQHRDRLRQPGGAAVRRMAVLISLPLLVYLLTIYLPLRARLFPAPIPAGNWHPLDWSHPVDFHRWFAHISAQQYKIHLWQMHTFAIGGHIFHFTWFKAPLNTLPTRLLRVVTEIFSMYLWCTPLLIVGAIASFRGEQAGRTGGKWLGRALCLTIFCNIGIEINYEVGDVTNFFLPAYECFAIWMGFGLAWFFSSMERRGALLDERGESSIWRWRFTTLAWMALLGTTCVQWAIFYGAATLRGVVTARDAGLERAAAAQQLHAATGRTPILLLMEDDALWSFWYVHYVLLQPQEKDGSVLPVITPWGLDRNRQDDSGRLADLVARLQQSGPVAISKFEDAVDARFPYQIITPSGNLCLATQRALPLPATPLAATANASKWPNGLLRGQYERSALALEQGGDPHNQDLSAYTPEAVRLLETTKVAALKGDDMAAFNVDFACTPAMRQAMASGPRDAANHTIQAGWVEVLMSRHGVLKDPPPDQGEVGDESSGIPPLRVWRQRRRLVLPESARAGTSWHTQLPLQIPTDAPVGGYTVWTRIVYQPNDSITAWNSTDLVFVTLK